MQGTLCVREVNRRAGEQVRRVRRAGKDFRFPNVNLLVRRLLRPKPFDALGRVRNLGFVGVGKGFLD